MTTRFSRPYLSQITPLHVTPSLNFNHNGVELGNVTEIKGWDYQSELHVSTELSRETFSTVIETCDLPKETSLMALIKWDSSTVQFGSSQSEVFEVTSNTATKISALMNSNNLGGKLNIKIQVFLGQDNKTNNPVLASSKGSILWESDIHSLALEGKRDSLPVAALDFSQRPDLNNTAGWAVHWSEYDMESSAGNCMQLLINTAHRNYSLLKESLHEGQKSPLIAAIYWDTASQIIERALNSEEFDDRDDWPPESIGMVLSRNLRTFFGDSSVDSVREMRKERPHEYHSCIQGVYDYLGKIS